MDSNFLIQLILEAEAFELSKSNKNECTLEQFRIWLNQKAYQKESPSQLYQKHRHEVFELENDICKQIMLLGRFSKQMIRKGLNDFPMLSGEDFTYLYRLMNFDSLSKTQLIEKNAHEKQTGMEIIKRLLKNGLMTEFQDDNDKRSKRLKVTELGKEVFKNSVQDVNITSKILTAKLDIDEKKQLLELLKKLNEFHFTVYQEFKDASLQEIHALI